MPLIRFNVKVTSAIAVVTPLGLSLSGCADGTFNGVRNDGQTCSANSDCASSAEPFCHGESIYSSGTCGVCEAGDCPDGFVCSSSGTGCESSEGAVCSDDGDCSSDEQCVGGYCESCGCDNPDLPICDAGACVQCIVSSDCSSSSTETICDAASSSCVQCIASSDCSSSTEPICDTTSSSCRGCGADADCSPGFACQVDGSCAAIPECSGDSDCSGSSSMPVCDDGSCRACQIGDCSSGTCAATGVCNDCTDTQWWNSGSSACQDCDVSCNGCSGGTSSDCSSCAAGYETYQGQCVTSCGSLEYRGGDDGTCQGCDPSCTTGCTDGSACDANICGVTDCGEFECGSTDSTIDNCKPGCAYGSGSGNKPCAACADGFKFQDASSPFAWYCEAIVCTNDSCGSCQADDTDYCLTCKESGYYAINGVCTMCQVSDCDTCSSGSSTECASCASGFYKTSQNQCSECSTGCATCDGSDSTQCTSCAAGYSDVGDGSFANCVVCLTHLSDQYCTQCSSTGCTQCSDGYFPDPSNSNVCTACIDNCDVCTDSQTCDQPASGYDPSLCDSSGCHSCVVEGYYQDNSSCLPCNGSCLSCSGPSANECSACFIGDANGGRCASSGAFVDLLNSSNSSYDEWLTELAWNVSQDKAGCSSPELTDKCSIRSQGGAAGSGSCVSEAQGYGVWISGQMFANHTHLGTTDDTAQEYFLQAHALAQGWIEMARLSGVSEGRTVNTQAGAIPVAPCQLSQALCDDPADPANTFPCLPAWLFSYDLSSTDGVGSASDGDEDAILGLIVFVEATEANKEDWFGDDGSAWQALKTFALQSSKAFAHYDLQFRSQDFQNEPTSGLGIDGCDQSTLERPLCEGNDDNSSCSVNQCNAFYDTNKGVSDGAVLMTGGSCWGGFDNVNPSYLAALANVRAMRDFMNKYDPSEGAKYTPVFDSAVTTTMKLFYDAINEYGQVPSWWTPSTNVAVGEGYEYMLANTDAPAGPLHEQSGTTPTTFCAEGGRTIYRLALFYTLYNDEFVSVGTGATANASFGAADILSRVQSFVINHGWKDSCNNLGLTSDAYGTGNCYENSTPVAPPILDVEGWVNNRFLFGPIMTSFITLDSPDNLTTNGIDAESFWTSANQNLWDRPMSYYQGSWSTQSTLLLNGACVGTARFLSDLQ